MADALVSFIVWFGITMLHKPKSRLFHFGYAKIESFAAFIAAVVIVVLGVFIVNFIIRNSGSIKYNKITL